jgi:hypothetical protein
VSIQAALPRQLNLQRVPLRVVLITMLASWALAFGAYIQGFPLYGIVTAALIPIIPLIVSEEIWKYQHYGFWAIFSTVMLLQLGHLGEHTVQVLQLLLYNGNFDLAHGVFGALDRETVHFFWDGSIWVGLIFLVIKFPRNVWLWIAFGFASMHMVEHSYLYYLDLFDKSVYVSNGGDAGILGKGGLLNGPLQRPYLHYIYNFLVVVPMLIGFWDQTKEAYDEYLARALPDMTHRELVTTSQQLHRLIYDPGDVVIKQGDTVDRFYIITHGEVEVIEEHADGSHSLVSLLLPGQFFGESGLLYDGRRHTTVRAVMHTELLTLDRDSFLSLVAKSTGARQDVTVEMQHRLAALRRIDPDAVPSL